MKKLLGTRTAFLLIILGLITVSFLVQGEENYLSRLLAFFFIALSVLFLLSSVCRCQELNWSVWRVLLLAFPLVGTILLLELMFLPGREREAFSEGGLP